IQTPALALLSVKMGEGNTLLVWGESGRRVLLLTTNITNHQLWWQVKNPISIQHSAFSPQAFWAKEKQRRGHGRWAVGKRELCAPAAARKCNVLTGINAHS